VCALPVGLPVRHRQGFGASGQRFAVDAGDLSASAWLLQVDDGV